MAEMELKLLLGMIIAVFGAVWVWSDAEKLRSCGAGLTPWIWALLTGLFLFPGLPGYLLLRALVWKKQATRSHALDLSDVANLPEPDMTPDPTYAPWKEA